MIGGGGDGRLRVVEKRHLPPAGVLPVHSGKIFIVLWATCARFGVNNTNKSEEYFLEASNSFNQHICLEFQLRLGAGDGGWSRFAADGSGLRIIEL